MRPNRARLHLLVVALVASWLTASSLRLRAQGDAAPNAAAANTDAVRKTDNVAGEISPQAPVITISGSCQQVSPRAPGPCNAVITRGEFEDITRTLDPNMTPRARQEFAASYARTLLFAREAEKQGLDKDPRFQKLLDLMRLQMLGQTLIQKEQEESQQVTPAEVEKFYHEDPRPFEVATVLRIFVPKAKLADPGDNPTASPSEKDAGMHAVAYALRGRAAAGEDFAALQKEAFQAADMKAPPPDTELGKITRERLARDQQSVFDLKIGDVSPVLEGTDAYYIYKLVSKDVPALDTVRDKVQRSLQNHRMEAWMKGITGSAKIEFNAKYFGGPVQTGTQARPPN